MAQDPPSDDHGPGGRSIVERAQFDVYVVDPELAYERSVSRWGATSHEDGRSEISEVTFLHHVRARGRNAVITVMSYIDDGPPGPGAEEVRTGSELGDTQTTRAVEAAVAGLTGVLWNKAQRDLDWGASSEAQDLRRDQMLQEAEDRAARSNISSAEIPADDKVVRFVLARDRTGACCAAARIGSVWIQITSEQLLPADVRLVMIGSRR
jgi:hypothetical protein